MTKKELQYFIRPESGAVDMIGPTFGPFKEFIQITYGELRIGPNGEVIGGRKEDGMWYFENNVLSNWKDSHNCGTDLDKTGFTDVVIWAE